jgi:hypothetical protein
MSVPSRVGRLGPREGTDGQGDQPRCADLADHSPVHVVGALRHSDADHTGGDDVRGADRSAQRRAGQYHRRGAALADEPIQRGHPVDAATDRAHDFPAAKGGSDGQRSRSHQTR